jgi:hypothetical protein
LRSPRFRFLTEAERYQAIEDHILPAPAEPDKPEKRRRVRKAGQGVDVQVFELARWRLPEKYRKRFDIRGLDVSDAAMRKMTKSCANPGVVVVGREEM